MTQDNPRGAIWDRLEQDQNEAKRNLEEAAAKESERVTGSALRNQLADAEAYILQYVQKEGAEFNYDMVKQALEMALAAGKILQKEKEAIERKDQKKEQMLLAAFNVLRYREFLQKYESDLKTRGWEDIPGSGVSRKQ